MDQNGPEDSHIQTHTKNEQPYLQSGITKPQKVTGDIKADRQTSKEHPGKHRGKTSQEKKEHHKNGSAPRRTSRCTIMKHG